MPRPVLGRVTRNFTLPAELLKQLDREAARRKVTRSAAIEDAVSRWLATRDADKAITAWQAIPEPDRAFVVAGVLLPDRAAGGWARAMEAARNVLRAVFGP